MTNVRTSLPAAVVELDSFMAELGLPLPPGVSLSDTRTPSIWLDDRLHVESSHWFRERADAVEWNTIRNDAVDLRVWIDFVHNSRGKTVHDVDQRDWKALVKAWRKGNGFGITDAQFKRVASVVKRFHTWLSGWPYDTPFRLSIERTMSPFGHEGSRLVGGPKPRPKERTPVVLHPSFLQPFLNAAGTPGSMMYERNRALVRYFVGSGLRRTAGAMLTHYEVPARVKPGTWAHVQSPFDISKTRSYTARVWPNLWGEVWEWMENIRPDFAEYGRVGNKHRPGNPLTIVEADDEEVKFVDTDGVVTERSWSFLTTDKRLRLVDVDGTSPAAWLTRDGQPFKPETAYYVWREAVRSAQRENPDLPNVRLHDARHIYATLGVVWWFYTNGLSAPAEDEKGVRLRAEDAVGMVKRDLGHVDRKTTEHYTATCVEWVSPSPDTGTPPVTREMIEGLR